MTGLGRHRDGGLELGLIYDDDGRGLCRRSSESGDSRQKEGLDRELFAIQRHQSFGSAPELTSTVEVVAAMAEQGVQEPDQIARCQPPNPATNLFWIRNAGVNNSN